MRVLVTGATGHVGANVCRRLLDRGVPVRALVRSSKQVLAGLDLETRSGDVLQPETLRSAFDGCGAVIHLAGKISISGDPDGSVIRTNVEGVRNVVDACLHTGVRRLVHMSSFHAFRQDPARPLTEEARQADDRDYVYDRSKAAGEREVDRGIDRGLEAVILNPTAIIGPFDHGPSLMGTALLDMVHGRMPALVPGGSDWVDVRDVADATIAGLEHGRSGDRHLLSGRWTTLRELADLVSRATGRTIPVRTVPGWVLRSSLTPIQAWARLTGATPLYTRQSLDALTKSSRDVRHDRASRALGFTPRPLDRTLADTFDWFRSMGWVEYTDREYTDRVET